MIFHLFLVVTISTFVWCTEQQQCGILNEDQLYNEDPTAALDEFPWIGQIYFSNLETREYKMMCHAILINKRYLLSMAHCFLGNRFVENNVPQFVVLGDSNFDNKITEPDCNNNGDCAPVSKIYWIQDIAVHPSYNSRRRTFDIAVVHVKEDVEFSYYIQPICLPPVSVHSSDFLAQYYHYAGFLNVGRRTQSSNKTKTISHIISLEQCRKTLNFEIASTYLCSSIIGNYDFLSGAALMGVNVINSKLSNFYLIGLSAYETLNYKHRYNIYTKISEHINWIYYNSDVSRNIKVE